MKRSNPMPQAQRVSTTSKIKAAQPPVLKPTDKILSIEVICGIYRGHAAARDALRGIYNEPQQLVYVEEWLDFHAESCGEIVERLRIAVPTDVLEAHMRA